MLLCVCHAVTRMRFSCSVARVTFAVPLAWLFNLETFHNINRMGWQHCRGTFGTCNQTNPLVLITKKENPLSKDVRNTANSGSVNTNGKAQIQLYLGLIRAPYRFCEYLKPIYHQWLNKGSLLKSMENLIWLPALAASSLMSSTASLKAELWKNKGKKAHSKINQKAARNDEVLS